MTRITFVLTLLLTISVSTLCDDTTRKNIGDGTRENPFLVPRAATTFKIDGVLDEKGWEGALVLDLKYEVEPGENVPAIVRTEVLLTYDSSTLYAAFRCYDDDPAAIRAHLTDREDFFGDDHVNIHIDTFNDERRSYTIGANPLGVQMDAYATGGSFDWSWDAIWDSAGRITEWGYVVELAIPFKQLRLQRTSGEQVWGFDAWRILPREVERYICVIPHDRSNNCSQCQMVKIKGFADVTPGRNVEISPTVTAVRTDERSDFPAGDFRKRDQAAEFGVTARWGITPNITLNGTANPDFSQIEADAQQLDINQPFALFYDERRPFFTESADIFSTQMDAVYTRTMRDPDWGFKLTGKEGDHTLGAYVVRDTLTNLIFPGSQGSSSTSLRMENTAAVMRYKLDIGSNYTLGGLFTTREGADYHNRLYGFDCNLRLTRMDRVRMQVLGSNTLYPETVAGEFGQETGGFGDRAIDLLYNHNTRSHDWYFGYQDYGAGFRADLGFIPRVDFRGYNAGWIYTWNAQRDTWWNRFSLGAEYNNTDDQDGNLLYRNARIRFDYLGAMQSGLNFYGNLRRECFDGKEFDLNNYVLVLWSTPNDRVSLTFISLFGDRIDYANGRLGGRLQVNPIVSLNLSTNLRLSFDYALERMTVDPGRLYTANIAQLSTIYQFNIRSFFKAIVQYVDYDYNAPLYSSPVDPEFKHLFTQLLYSYKINPQTVLFVGYSDNYYGAREFGLTQSDRTFFMKLGYAWQL